MNREGHDKVKFFIGPEVEHTPAYSRKTLFVVGKQTIGDIRKLAQEHKVSHVFMGANHSFNSASQDPYWDQVITALLDFGYWVTLDYQAHEHEQVLKMLNPGIWQCRQFVPLLGVRIPKVQTSNVNLTVKIDDVDFKATNPGVWCLHWHEVTDSNRFTDWQEYGSDVVISDTVVIDPGPTSWAGGLKVPVPTKTTVLESESDLTPEQKQKVIDNFQGTALNDGSLGLDPDSKSLLKPEPGQEEEALAKVNITTAADAANAYAEAGTKAKGKKKVAE